MLASNFAKLIPPLRTLLESNRERASSRLKRVAAKNSLLYDPGLGRFGRMSSGIALQASIAESSWKNMSLSLLSAVELSRQLEAKEVSAADVMRSVLSRIESVEPDVQAFISLDEADDLVGRAEKIDQRRMRGEAIGPLSGLPIALKDNMCVKDKLTTCASKMLKEFKPPYSATVVERIEDADGIIIGKTNMDEFSMGSSTENSAFQVTRNPANLDYVPGGTSGGSAAAVVAHETILALGADTGGSVRQPAAFCGVVGLKPTYGRVSRYGLIAYASSFDQIGVLSKSVADCALTLQTIAGHDNRDSTSLDAPVPNYLESLSSDTKYRFGIPAEYFIEGVAPEVSAAVRHTIDQLQENGHSIVEVPMKHTPYALPTYYIVASAEASSNLARYDGCHFGYRSKQYADLDEMILTTRTEGFGAEVRRRIMLGAYVLSAGYKDAFYNKSLKVRRLIKDDFVEAFKQCDLLIHPITPTPAFRIGEKTDDPLTMYLSDVFSVIANLAGVPAISVPCGKADNGLPIGVQLVAPWLGEQQLLHAAQAIENCVGPA